MLQKSINFIHNFDERVHHAVNYALDVYKDSDIEIHDSVQNKQCFKNPGRWSFIVEGNDFSCAIYESLEMMRQTILDALGRREHKVEFALISPHETPNKSYLINYKNAARVIDIERLKNSRLFAHNEPHSCKSKISNKLFYSVIKPVLKQVLGKQDFNVTLTTFEKEVSEKVGQIVMHFKRNLPLIRIEWGENENPIEESLRSAVSA